MSECRFTRSGWPSVCEEHNAYASLCASAAAALQGRHDKATEDNDRLRWELHQAQNRVQELVKANEHWHTRIEQMKQQVDSSEAEGEEK